MDQRKNWIKIIVLGLVWGASFMFTATALVDFGPMTITAARISLGALALWITLKSLGGRLPNPRGENGLLIWAIALTLGAVSNALPFTLLNWGMNYVASGFAGVCMAIVPLLVLPLAHLFVPGERMTLRRSAGFAIGFAGVVILIGPAALQSSGIELEIWGRIACVVAAMSYAVGVIITRLCPPVDRIAFATAILICGALVSLPLAFFQEGVPSGGSFLPILSIVYLGLLPTGLAQVLLVQVIRDAGPTFMTLVNYQVPLWSVVFGIVFLSEDLPPSLFLATALILCGMALSQLGQLRRIFGNARAKT